MGFAVPPADTTPADGSYFCTASGWLKSAIILLINQAKRREARNSHGITDPPIQCRFHIRVPWNDMVKNKRKRSQKSRDATQRQSHE